MLNTTAAIGIPKRYTLTERQCNAERLTTASSDQRPPPDVQWAINFNAAQIGIFQPEHRQRCIALGERTGLYKDEVVAKNCTPNYLPLFIEIQVTKLKK